MVNIPTIHSRTGQASKPVRRSQKVTPSEHSKDEEQSQSEPKERRQGERRKRRMDVHMDRRSRHTNRRYIRRANSSSESNKQETTERVGRHINTEA